MIKIYHNPRCKKSRAGLKYLQDKNLDFEIINYIKNPISEEELKGILMKLNKKPQEIVRFQEADYKNKYEGKEFYEHEWIQILLENPKLIQRPIIEKKYKAVIGDPIENIEELF